MSAIVGTDQHSQCAERTGATFSVVGRSASEPLPVALRVSVYIIFIVLYKKIIINVIVKHNNIQYIYIMMLHNSI